MFRPVETKTLPMILATLFLAFGIQLAAAPSMSQASDSALVFTNKPDINDLDLEDFDFEDAEFEDEEFEEAEEFDKLDRDAVLQLILLMKKSGSDLQDLLKDEEKLDEFFDSEESRGFLKRNDFERLSLLNRLLLNEADKRFFFDRPRFFAEDDDFFERPFVFGREDFFEEDDSSDEEDFFKRARIFDKEDIFDRADIFGREDVFADFEKDRVNLKDEIAKLEEELDEDEDEDDDD
jgi:hypothetical protein